MGVEGVSCFLCCVWSFGYGNCEVFVVCVGFDVVMFGDVDKVLCCEIYSVLK